MLFHPGLRSVDGKSVPWDLEGENDVAGTERRAGTEWGQMRSTIGKGLVFVVADRHLHQLGPEKAWNADRYRLGNTKNAKMAGRNNSGM